MLNASLPRRPEPERRHVDRFRPTRSERDQVAKRTQAPRPGPRAPDAGRKNRTNLSAAEILANPRSEHTNLARASLPIVPPICGLITTFGSLQSSESGSGGIAASHTCTSSRPA